MTFDASTFTPGDRLVLARVMASTATTQTLTIASETETISATVISNGSPTWPDLLTNTYSVIPVGVMTLPPRDATSGTFDLDITATALTLDDLYFAPLDGELTLLDVSGTYDGHDVEVVELSSASTGSPVPTIRVGLADGTYMTDLEPGRVLAWGQHQATRVRSRSRPSLTAARPLTFRVAPTLGGSCDPGGLHRRRPLGLVTTVSDLVLETGSGSTRSAARRRRRSPTTSRLCSVLAGLPRERPRSSRSAAWRF